MVMLPEGIHQNYSLLVIIMSWIRWKCVEKHRSNMCVILCVPRNIRRYPRYIRNIRVASPTMMLWNFHRGQFLECLIIKLGLTSNTNPCCLLFSTLSPSWSYISSPWIWKGVSGTLHIFISKGTLFYRPWPPAERIMPLADLEDTWINIKGDRWRHTYATWFWDGFPQ